jgi:hypothetical protein
VVATEIDRTNNRLYAYLSPWVILGQYIGALATDAILKHSGGGVIGAASSANIVGAITWPGGNQVVLSPTSTSIAGSSGVLIDPSGDGTLFIASDGEQVWRNLGVIGAGTYEHVRAFWSSNVWILATESVGGTERDMLIGNASTAAVSVTAGGGVTIVGGSVGSAPSVTTTNLKIFSRPIAARVSAVGATLDAFHVAGETISVTGSTNITTATGFNYVTIDRPTYSGNGVAKTVDFGATVYIANAPLAASSLTLANAYALWVDDGTTRLDGNVQAGGAASTAGFFGSAGQAKAAVTGSRSGNAALASLLTLLANHNLLTDSSSA